MIRALATFFFAVLTLTLLQAGASAVSIVNFWLSNVENGPAVETLFVAPNSIQTMDIWGRPEDGNVLNAISLNLVAAQSVALSFQQITVHNPAIGNGFRH
ncbi:MAG: hypothetical protein ABGX16_23730 [Pirellulales bacterium]